MRVAIGFAVLLLVGLSLQLECEDFQVTSEKRKLDGRVVQTLFADSENTQIYILTSKNSVYKSSDRGASFKKQMSYMSHSDAKQPGYDESGIKKMFKTSIDGHVLFLGFGYQYWTTDGNDQSYTYYHEKDGAWKEFIPSTQEGDAILGIKFSGSCLTYEDCYQTLYYSNDWGANWSLLRSYVYKASWADNGSLYLVSVPNELQSGSQDGIIKENRVLYRMNKQAEILFTSTPGFFDYENSNGILYATRQINQTLELSISSDRGASFTSASFIDSLSDFPQDVSKYTFLDNSGDVTFLHVNRDNSINYGSLYEANTSDGEFWLTLRSNRVSPGTHIVDFQPIQGQNGIFIANQYNISLLMEDNPANEQYVTSVISFNKGGSWSRVPVPANSLCSSQECSLHLNSAVDGQEILSSSEVAGIILASGNEGTVKLTRDDNINLYLSRDAGFSWERIQEGPRVFNWGNFGSLFVSTTSASETNSIEFSWDQGITWSSCDYASSAMEVEGIIPVAFDSLEFLLYGSTDVDGDLDGYVFYLNFSENITSVCSGQNAPDDVVSDFEAWNTQWDDGCLLGEDVMYTRRKRESVCVVTSAPFVVSSAACECTRNDYICDTPCYVPQSGENGEIECVMLDACKSANDEPDECDSGTITSKGYQLIAEDMCKGGLNLAAQEQNCTTSTAPHSTFTVGFLSYVMLAVFIGLAIFSLVLLLLLFLYKTNEGINDKLSPFVPDWCTRDPGEAADEDKLYSQLDDSSDGNFDDWADIPAYYDPMDDKNGTVTQEGVPDVHDTDATGLFGSPQHVYNPYADLIEYKFTHDADNFYAYFKTSSTFGVTSTENSTTGTSAGRYYAIVTIDLDGLVDTGYWLDEGGYYPTSGGYDINMEVEFYNGTFNSGHYLNHGCHNEPELLKAFDDQEKAQIHWWAGFYSFYTQWVFWDIDSPPTEDEISRCPDDMITLPNAYGYLCFVRDKAPGPFQGSVTYAKSGQEFEMKAPYKGLLLDGVNPFVHEGMTVNVSFSVETSGEYGTPNRWCSDTGMPIKGYYMEGNTTNSETPLETNSQGETNYSTNSEDSVWKFASLAIIGAETGVIFVLVLLVIGLLIAKNKSGSEKTKISDSWE